MVGEWEVPLSRLLETKGDKIMAYEKQTWACGDTITAEKLNHMEDGIEAASSGGGTPLVVNVTEREATPIECAYGGSVFTLDKTWQEISDAFPNVYLSYDDGAGIYSVVGVYQIPQYGVVSWGETYFESDSADGYPLRKSCDPGPSPS